MNLLKYRIKKSTCLQLSFLFTFLVSPVSLFAFSDMNDSTSQDDVVKSLQKRLDSLELRFEKSEIEKNEAKKCVFDWSRGLYLSVSMDIVNFASIGTCSFGYMVNKTKKDGRKTILCPQIRSGSIHIDKPYIEFESTTSKYPGRRSLDVFTSIGVEKIKQVAERLSYIDGWFINIVPSFSDQASPLYAFGCEYTNSVNFFYNENSSLGIGTYYRLTASLGNASSWKTALKKGAGFGATYQLGFRIIYTSSFARHEAKSRSK